MQSQLQEMEARLRAKEQALGSIGEEKGAAAAADSGRGAELQEDNTTGNGNGVDEGAITKEEAPALEEAQVSTDPDGNLVFSFLDEDGGYG